MPRRKDKEPSTSVNSGIRVPADLLDTLTRAADAKGVSRNALIVAMLTKATKTKKAGER